MEIVVRGVYLKFVRQGNVVDANKRGNHAFGPKNVAREKQGKMYAFETHAFNLALRMVVKIHSWWNLASQNEDSVLSFQDWITPPSRELLI
jgi:hypothetical protein